MPLSQTDLEAVEAIIGRVLEMHSRKHVCRFAAIPEDKTPEVVHAVGMITDLGKGDMREGVEILRENHRTLLRWREKISQMAMVVGGLVITTIVGGFLAACWVGFRMMAKP